MVDSKVLDSYLKSAPSHVVDRAVLIADTTKLCRMLLADAVGGEVKDIPVELAFEAALFACKDRTSDTESAAS